LVIHCLANPQSLCVTRPARKDGSAALRRSPLGQGYPDSLLVGSWRLRILLPVGFNANTTIGEAGQIMDPVGLAPDLPVGNPGCHSGARASDEEPPAFVGGSKDSTHSIHLLQTNRS
jgi:hypothetical protein